LGGKIFFFLFAFFFKDNLYILSGNERSKVLIKDKTENFFYVYVSRIRWWSSTNSWRVNFAGTNTETYFQIPHFFLFCALQVPFHGVAPHPLCSIHAIVSTSPILCHIKLLQVSKDQQETMDQCAHRSAASWSGVLWALITARICTSSILFVWRIPSPITGWHKGVDLDNMYSWKWVSNNTVTDKHL